MVNSEPLAQQSRYTYQSAGSRTRIDHMYHSPTARLESVEKGCRLVRNVYHHNGHAGILASYRIDQGKPNRWQFVLRQITKAQKDFSDPVVIAEVTEKFKTLSLDMTLPAAARLDKLTDDAVLLVHPHKHKVSRNRVCRDWSPDSVALELHLKRVVNLCAILAVQQSHILRKLKRRWAG